MIFYGTKPPILGDISLCYCNASLSKNHGFVSRLKLFLCALNGRNLILSDRRGNENNEISYKFSLKDTQSTAAWTKGDISVHRPNFCDL